MMMASSVKETDVPDTPTKELDYLTIIPLHEEEVEYFIYPYSDSHRYDVFPFYYRINKGEWVEVNVSGNYDKVFCINLNKTKELQLKCNSVEFNPESLSVQYFSISSIGSFSLGGTPMSIIYGDDFNAYDYVPDSFLQSTFANNLGLERIVNPETFLPYTNLGEACYVSLFAGCTSLTNSPTLHATTLTCDCYAMMFHGCSNLKHIKMLAKEAKSTSGISIGIEDCLYDWVNGVSPTGTFVKHPDMTSLPTGVNGIPEGWAVVNDGEESGGGDTRPPESTEFEFPLYLNTEVITEEEGFLYRERLNDSITNELLNLLTSEFGYPIYPIAIDDWLKEHPIYIDGYLVTGGHIFTGEIENIRTDNTYGGYDEISICIGIRSLWVEAYKY